MKLIGIHLSPFVRKVAVALTVKGIEYEQEVVLPGTASEEFLRLSPLGKIPVLVDGDLVIPDSSVICEYLEDIHPEPSMFPVGPADRSRARFLEEYGDTRLVEVTSPVFIENFAAPNFFDRPSDEARARQAETELIPTRAGLPGEPGTP